jgi:hypothetical protein
MKEQIMNNGRSGLSPFFAPFFAAYACANFISSPDEVEARKLIVAHVGVILYMAVAINLSFPRVQDKPKPSMRMKAALCAGVVDVLILVGAGYSTKVEPGVIKLADVLPLGWSCAVVVLLDRMVAAHAPADMKWDWMQRNMHLVRTLLLTVGVIGSLIEKLYHGPDESLRIVLTLILALSGYGLVTRFVEVRRLLEAKEKD